MILWNEPASLALFGVGVIGFLLGRKKKRSLAAWRRF